MAARWVADRSLNTKILMVIALLAGVALSVGLLSITRMSAINAEAEALYTHALLPLERVHGIETSMRETQRDVLNHALSTTETSMRKMEDDMKGDDAAFDGALAAYQADSTVPAKADELRALWADYRQATEGLLTASRSNDMAAVERIRDAETAPRITKALAKIEEISDAETADAVSRKDRAAATYESARTTTIVFLTTGIALAILFGLWIARGIVSRVRRVAVVVDGLATGDLTRRTDVDSRDEIGIMAAQLDAATAGLRETVSRIGGNSESLAGAAQELSTVSTQIAGNAEQASSRADMVSSAAEQVSTNIETVAAASEEMTASIREIAGSATDAAGVARSAVDVAESANTTVSKLGQSSAEIGNIVNVITSIAEQSNLLALNATIEAARAGEAGKGFAVVASEVKDLAQETAKATEEISSRIQAIQTDTGAAVDAIAQISGIIEKISSYSETIASAVEEQTATTTEIGRNVAEAATGSTDIASNITGVATAAQSTSEGVAEAQRAAEELAQMSSDLKQLVDQFRV
ncbi:MAG TPA: methyl-accepting chemotaxis protein [Pilimelia sp.]|nr:methyl-accepting chemotaxis protein [Pilimelia sp.]